MECCEMMFKFDQREGQPMVFDHSKLVVAAVTDTGLTLIFDNKTEVVIPMKNSKAIAVVENIHLVKRTGPN